MHLYASGSSNSKSLEWYIDTSYSELSIGEIIDQLFNFLAKNKHFIKKFKFSTTYKLGDPKQGENPRPYFPGCSL
jgi:hypothetical protein